ncbi:MAG: adenylate/guanylate cyclase domain-containing protein [Cyclobacteriaceae bacterium]
MNLGLSPKAKRNISKIIPFAVIWVLSGWVIIITEVGVTRNQNLNPETDISFTIPVLIFANFANVIVGLIVGSLEVIYLQKRFESRSLRAKFFYKFLIYLSLFLIVIVAFYPIAFALDTDTNFSSDDAWEKLAKFLTSVSFLTTLFQLSVSLTISLVYSAISENLGHNVLINFLTGKYHKPKKEERVFMFLDMKQSTTIAEQLGHEQYFNLLRDYYEVMSDSIINSLGEVYQYIGDEVVITWESTKGLTNLHCIQCFKEIKKSMSNHADSFNKKYGLIPDFKAGLHIGEVTTGEIGALKKEIFYTGDVLNTTARVQGMCNENNTDLILTSDLLNRLDNPDQWNAEYIGELPLKGKSKPVKLYRINL